MFENDGGLLSWKRYIISDFSSTIDDNVDSIDDEERDVEDFDDEDLLIDRLFIRSF